jgi:aspartate kinase
MTMSPIVLKFGGASVADNERLQRVADLIAARRSEPIVVVVSAQQGHTDELIDTMQSLTTEAPADALDALKAVGELQSAALLAAAVTAAGCRAEAILPWQVIRTDAVFGDATIQSVYIAPLLERLKRGIVPIVPGFVGVTSDGRLTTLGRGGSDYTAVALGVALLARRVELCKAEVDGVYTADPHTHPEAQRFDALTHEQAVRLARGGAKVLQGKAADLAQRWQIPILIRSTFGKGRGTSIIADVYGKAGLALPA